MGTLDEAIRQHLDLKRRSGADPGEVAKLEREAFGPIRREDALAVPPPDSDEPAGDPEPAEAPAGSILFDAHADGPSADAPLEVPFEAADGPVPAPFDLPEAPHLGGPDVVEPAAPAAEPPAQVEPFEPHDERPRAPAAPPDPEPVAPPSRDPGEIIGERTVEFSALDHAEATAADAPDDVEPVDELEETPEFLEETPEHDRLWFEQKPPRDFDF